MRTYAFLFLVSGVLLLAPFSLPAGDAISTISVELSDPPESFKSNVGKKNDFQAQVWVLPEQPWVEGGGISYSYSGSEPVETINALHGPLMVGQKADIWVVFRNPAVDERGRSGVLMDFIVRHPDGSVHGECRNVAGWVDKDPVPRDEFIKAEHRFCVKLDQNEPAGVFQIEVTVKDMLEKVEIPLRTSVEFKLPE